MKTVDDGMLLYERADVNSPTRNLPSGSEIELGSQMIVDSRDWFPATIIEPGGESASGYVLAASVRSHTVFR
jgi:hypothetical protein